MDMGGDSDPYVAIAISNPPGFLRSRTCINTSSPRWDQILFLRINLVPQIMRIEVWDDDFGEKQDDFIGSGAIHLSEFVAQTKAFFAAGGRDGEHPEPVVTVPISRNGHKQGCITARLKIMPLPCREPVEDGSVGSKMR